MIIPRLLFAALAMLGIGASNADAPQQRQDVPTQRQLVQEAEARGRALVDGACVSCHAVGRYDTSALPDAPPLREVVRRYQAYTLGEAFAEGIVTGHPAMPQFVFRAAEIEDIVAYLETLEAEE